ncbi:MAG: 1-(5-phosphoribosyl)-5-[(5-phosphoribosylamino)methylideneamino] imidazole-4-carboxamide isomerase [Gemmatimonadales bacterium]|nr:MAG: 1-(5-phosphoribosyl)-5-[(5-phosphoribosylamino)methylideneamino] imidazole-4-carboxamide isomerase [Gemmatimonadales bacterium]
MSAETSQDGPEQTGSHPRASFQAIPAVDLKGGRCVQLVGGRPEEEKVSLPDPVAVARRWSELGYRTLHVVDLDAALGSGDNAGLVAQVVEATDAVVQVGGGIRDDARAEALLEAGVDRIIVGTRAVEEPAWLAELAGRHPGAVVVAADIRDGLVLRRGWTRSSDLAVVSFLEGLASLPLAGALCTDVGREGRLQGMDREEVARIIAQAPHPIWISGGVSTLDDLRFLKRRGAAGAVLGMALYTGALDEKQVAEEFGG